MPLISIICPVFKGEAFLSICIDSVLDQTFKNFELILIDDNGEIGSQKSSEICEEHAIKDPRIKLIKHTKNQGIASTRNTGLKYATGEYIQFIDCDDFIEKEMMQSMLDRICHDNTDIAICGYKIINMDSDTITNITYGSDLTIHSKTDITELLDSYDSVVSPIWTRLINRKILDKLSFKSIYVPSDDMALNYEIFKKTQNISILNKSFYHWIQHKNNRSKKGIPSKANIHLLQLYIDLLFSMQNTKLLNFCGAFPTFIWNYFSKKQSFKYFILLKNSISKSPINFKPKLNRKNKVPYLFYICLKLPTPFAYIGLKFVTKLISIIKG